MNKTDLINTVSEKTGSTKVEVKNIIEATLESFSDALRRGERITLAGFGSFFTTEKAARQGMNPRTQEEITIPEHTAVKFKAAPELQDYLESE